MGWSEGAARFGILIGTAWSTGELWLRRDFEPGALPPGELLPALHHGEGVEVFLDGEPSRAWRAPPRRTRCARCPTRWDLRHRP